MKNETRKPQWQPIGELFYLGGLMDEDIDVAHEQRRLLKEAQSKPHVLDDAIMDRIDKLFTGHQEFIGIYTEQCRRWRQENTLNPKQESEVQRLETRLPEWRAIVDEILALHHEMKDYTIDKIMTKDDAELGAKILNRTAGLTPEHIALAARIDREIKRLLADGGEEAVLHNMSDYMADFKRLMDETDGAGLNILAARYKGFHQFTSLLERMASAIQSGHLKVPPA